jgi:hypothetical protein
MPIKGLTDTVTVSRGLPRIGKIYKGGEKGEKRPGPDLNHFRVDFEPEFEHIAGLWAEMYGDEPTEFAPVYVLGSTADEAFPAFKEDWNGAGTCLHRCDGEVQYSWYNPQTHMMMSSRIACASPVDPKTGQQLTKGCECKNTGRLKLILSEFTQAAGVMGYFEVVTHSTHDILNITGALLLLERRGVDLLGIPFVFGRAARELNVPKTVKGGAVEGRMKTTKSLLYLRPDEEFVRLAMLARPSEPAALPAPQVERARLGAGKPEDRRIGGNGNGNPEPQPGPAPEPPAAINWAEISDWAMREFKYSESHILEALSAAQGEALQSLNEWPHASLHAYGAIIASAYDYDLPKLNAALGKMKRPDLMGVTIAIAKRVLEPDF